MVFEFSPIGIVRSPYKEKFGVPRQAGIVADVEARLEMLPGYDIPEAFEGLEAYSHIWVHFVFNANVEAGWQPKVRPPRLGGNKKVGVFASRAPFRPNPIGLSVIGLSRVEVVNGKVVLIVNGIDMVDGTPILDIKPYVSYSDSYPDARCGFAISSPEHRFTVAFSERAKVLVEQRSDIPSLRAQITQLLATDPRPAYMKEQGGEREYGFKLYDFDLRWVVEDETVVVLDLVPITQ